MVMQRRTKPATISSIFAIGVSEETEPNAAIPPKNGRTEPL
jgi:hypothetical protein